MTSNDVNQFHILIADPNPVFRLGVRSLLQPASMFPTLLDADSQEVLRDTLLKNRIEIVILGIGQSSEGLGFDWALTSRQIRKDFPNTRILLIPRCTEIYSLEELMDAGASGYVPLHHLTENLLSAIRQVAAGKIYVEEPFRSKTPSPAGKGGHFRSGSSPSPITKRELEILRLIYQEYTNPEIANLLGISRRTVDTHRKNLLRKLNVRNTAGLIRFALRSGYVDL